MTDKLIFVEDRTPIRSLSTLIPERILSLFRSRNGSLFEEKDRIHFCGQLMLDSSTSVFFLPRNSDAGDHRENKKIARMTMLAISKYRRKAPMGHGIHVQDLGNPSLQSLMQAIYHDFAEHGLYSSRNRETSRGSGKTDWSRTFRKSGAMVTEYEEIVFSDVYGSRHVTDFSDPLSYIHWHVLQEISGTHSWWLTGANSFDFRLTPKFRNRRISPERMLLTIRQSRRLIYGARHIRLMELLEAYLLNESMRYSGLKTFGTEHFHYVWEDIVRNILTDVDEVSRGKFPSLSFFNRNGIREVDRKSRLIPDVVVNTGGDVKIIDAKYYGGFGMSSMPGVSDFVKQFAYEVAARHLFPARPISSHYILPRSLANRTNFCSVSMSDLQGAPIGAFPSVSVNTLDVRKAIESYLSGRRAAFDEVIL